jgi:hypothetical protein
MVVGAIQLNDRPDEVNLMRINLSREDLVEGFRSSAPQGESIDIERVANRVMDWLASGKEPI